MSAVASTNPEEAGQEGSDTDAAGASSSTNTKPGQSQPEIVYSETGASSGGAGDATNPSVPRTLPSLPVMIQAPPFATGTNNPIPHNGQQQTSFLQSLRQQNPEPKIFNEWTIRPPFSTFSETPGLIGYQGVPVTVRNSSPTTCPNSFILEKNKKFSAGNGASVSGGVCLQSRRSPWHYSNRPEIYSRKVFIGGLPIDTDQDDLFAVFGQFGNFEIDWPRKSQNRAFYPPKGYVFLIFDEESSVHFLMESCYCENDKFYICVSSPTVKNKPAQVRPWRLSDADFVVDPNAVLDPRKSVYLTGIPRPIKASELVYTMEKLFKGVCYAGIDMDPGLKYPSGAGRVAFRNRENYIAALSSKYVHLRHADMDKQALVTPYILDNQPCDICWSAAPYFCVNVSCLQYYCEMCWKKSHSRPGFESHKPTVKEIYEKNRIAKARVWKSGAAGISAAF